MYMLIFRWFIFLIISPGVYSKKPLSFVTHGGRKNRNYAFINNLHLSYDVQRNTSVWF